MVVATPFGKFAPLFIGPEWSDVWHSWHNHGVRAFSSGGLFEP